MKSPLSLKQKIALILLLLSVCVSGSTDLTAEAKKKAEKIDPAAQAAAEAEAKSKAAEAEIQKGLAPITAQLTQLMTRIQGRGLFSPKEAGELVTLKYKLLDLMEKFPQHTALARPVYQAGTLFVDREAYNDAFEMFNYLAQGYVGNPYGAKAKGQIQILERQFGANYFSVEMAASSVPANASAPEAPATESPPAAPATAQPPASPATSAPAAPAKK